MKTALFMFLFFAMTAILAQADYACAPTFTDNLVEKPISNNNHATSLILMPNVMNEKDVVLAIQEKNDSELNRLLKKIKFAKMFQNIGFAAIPEAIIGGGLITAASTNINSFKEQKQVGVGLVALSAACLSSSLCFKFIRTKNYKNAIKRYNELYY